MAFPSCPKQVSDTLLGEALRICLNRELAKKPPACLEYILVHEMVRFLERHHNERFRDLMDNLMPQRRLHREDLKRAAVLLFHADPERFVTGASIKIGHFDNDADLRFHDEVHGDLFTQVDRTMDLLLTKYLTAEIAYEGVQRVETYPVPESALREALLNAVAHKDYASGTPIQIRVYDDRVSFWNNGHLPENWTVQRLAEKHPSQPYNPDVANALFRAGLIEAWGRGIEKVLQACREAGMADPQWRYETPGLWVEFAKRGQAGTKLGLSSEHVTVARKCLSPQGIQVLMEAAGRKSRTKFRDQVLKPLLEMNLVEMSVPDKPRSPKQQYQLTARGRAVLENIDRRSQTP